MKRLLDIYKFINGHPLAKRHKLKAFYKFIKWQVLQFISPRLVTMPFVGSTQLIIKKGMVGATGNIYTGLHDFSEMGFLLHFLQPDDLFIDIGANVGCYTILASGVIGANSICIEPIPVTFRFLQKNILQNKLQQKVRSLNIAAGSKNELLLFTKELDVINHVVIGGKNDDKDLLQIQVKPLDDIVDGQCPILIKIDVEGFEQEVISGAVKNLKNATLKAIIIELNGSGINYGYSDKHIHQQLVQLGFSPYQYYPFERELTEMDSYGKTNTIYLRDINFIKSRLKSGTTINIFSEVF